MQIIEPSYQILTDIDPTRIMYNIERAGRTAYKSEDRITSGSAEKLIKDIIKRGHESVLEHETLSVRFICDRGVSHEIVRHRLCAFTQESTRYCNYVGKGITFIRPFFWKDNDVKSLRWRTCIEECENSYNYLIKNGATPQEARSVLPNSLKTEIVVTANIREWRHILTLRTAKSAHPQMRQIMIPLLKELQQKLPILFEDIKLNE
jgi:thymidylate synthase (FAD)